MRDFGFKILSQYFSTMPRNAGSTNPSQVSMDKQVIDTLMDITEQAVVRVYLLDTNTQTSHWP